jgi:hypothetical protein
VTGNLMATYGIAVEESEVSLQKKVDTIQRTL